VAGSAASRTGSRVSRVSAPHAGAVHQLLGALDLFVDEVRVVGRAEPLHEPPAAGHQLAESFRLEHALAAVQHAVLGSVVVRVLLLAAREETPVLLPEIRGA